MFETIWRKKKDLKFFKSPEGKIAFIENDKGYFCLGGSKALNCMPFKDKPVCGYYVTETVSKEISKKYKALPLGFSYKVSLEKFSLNKPYFKRITNYSKKNNYKFSYHKKIDAKNFKKIKNLEKQSIKLKVLPALGFLLSKAESENTEWALVEDGQQLVAALGFNKVNDQSYYLDNIISIKKRFSIDYSLLETLRHMKSQGVLNVDLGVVPFSGLTSKKNIFYWGQYFNWFYSSKGLAHFKKTYATHSEPVFCYFDKRKSLIPQLYQLAKLHFS